MDVYVLEFGVEGYRWIGGVFKTLEAAKAEGDNGAGFHSWKPGDNGAQWSRPHDIYNTAHISRWEVWA